MLAVVWLIAFSFGLPPREAARPVLYNSRDNFFRLFFQTQPPPNSTMVWKWTNYWDPYDLHFSRFRGKSPLIVEVGVQSGGSIRMWTDYFGPGMRYLGIDINKNCRQFEDLPRVRVLIGSSSDPLVWQQVAEIYPEGPDIILDDGGHFMLDQIGMFPLAWPLLKKSGIYAVEDVDTSYWEEFGGRRHGNCSSYTFVDYTRRLIDLMHEDGNKTFGELQNEKPSSLHPEGPDKTIFPYLRGIHAYRGIIFFGK